jgi:tripartite-type tricarboxylate transporter receptor subunit TctC
MTLKPWLSGGGWMREEHRMNLKLARFPLKKFALALALALLTGITTNSEAADSFYEGKVVTIVNCCPAGAAYDLYSRTLAEFLPNFIPGRPAVVVDDMPGANGAVSAGYMFNIAPRDGTVIASGVAALPTYPLLHPDIANKFDVTKLSWIGSITKDVYIAYVWQSAPIQTYEEAKQTPVILGGVMIGAPSIDLAVVSNALFGTKFKIVTGYDADTVIELAVERGEIQGTFGVNYSGFKTRHVDWLRDHKIKIILQHGLDKLPDLPDVPLFIDQAKTPEDREALQLLLAQQEFSKPFYAPPGIPADRLDILRRAFDSAVEDPGFLAAAAKANIPVTSPMNGEALTAAVAEVAGTPPVLVDRVKGILANFAQQ